MISRRKTLELIELIDSNPAVALLGPRQVGKTTLALEIGAQAVDLSQSGVGNPIKPSSPSRTTAQAPTHSMPIPPVN